MSIDYDGDANNMKAIQTETKIKSKEKNTWTCLNYFSADYNMSDGWSISDQLKQAEYGQIFAALKKVAE